MSSNRNASMLTDLIPFISELKEAFNNWEALDDNNRSRLNVMVELKHTELKSLVLALEQWDDMQNYGQNWIRHILQYKILLTEYLNNDSEFGKCMKLFTPGEVSFGFCELISIAPSTRAPGVKMGSVVCDINSLNQIVEFSIQLNKIIFDMLNDKNTDD